MKGPSRKMALKVLSVRVGGLALGENRRLFPCGFVPYRPDSLEPLWLQPRLKVLRYLAPKTDGVTRFPRFCDFVGECSIPPCVTLQPHPADKHRAPFTAGGLGCSPFGGMISSTPLSPLFLTPKAWLLSNKNPAVWRSFCCYSISVSAYSTVGPCGRPSIHTSYALWHEDRVSGTQTS